MQKIIPTQLANYLQVVNYVGKPFEKKENTTLNQKFDIQASANLPANSIPSLKAYVIGIGGHDFTTGANGIPLPTSVDHQSDNFGLYNHLPFVLRPINNDLTAAERAKYCLRNIKEYDGVNYYAYWGKRLDLSSVTVQETKRTTKDGITTVEEFVAEEANLSPTPPAIPNTGVTTSSGVYLATSCIIPMPFTETDVQEMFNVAKIIFGDERYAIMSEFGFVTGVDADVAISTPSGQVQFKELLAAQISAIISSKYELIFNSKGFDFSLEVGAVQPLLSTDSATVTTTLKLTTTTASS